MTPRLIHILLITIPLALINGSHAQDDHWRPLAPMPTPRYGHVAVALDSVIYVIGGRQSEQEKPLKVVEIYDPATDTWQTDVTPMREKRANAAAVAHEGKIWVIGGREDKDVLDDVEIFDPVSGHWEDGPELKIGREGLTAVVLAGTIYAVGGFGEDGNPVPGSEFFDPETEEWRLSSDWQLIVPRVAMATVVIRDSAFTMGGVGSIGGSLLVPVPFVELYHPATGVLMQTPMRAVRAYFAAAAVGDSIYVFGGFGVSGGSPQLRPEVDLFGPAAGMWSTVSTLSVPREGLATAVVDRKIYLFGGRTSDLLASDLSEEFSPLVTAVESRPASVPREFHLKQNYPNPFYAEGAASARPGGPYGTGTVVNFVLGGRAPVPVRLQIVNLRGQVVRTLVDETLAPGDHSVRWDGLDDLGRSVSSGVYLYRLIAGAEQQVRKMTLIR